MIDKDSDGRHRGNADYQWSQFDPEAYFEQYYGEPHPDDDHVVRLAAGALKEAVPEGALDVVDVGIEIGRAHV